MSKNFDKKLTVTYTTESSYTRRKNTEIAEFSVVTPEQSKFNKPVDTTIPSMTHGCDPLLTTLLNELLRTVEPEQESNTFWFSPTENLNKNEGHTPMQARTLIELNELKEKE